VKLLDANHAERSPHLPGERILELIEFEGFESLAAHLSGYSERVSQGREIWGASVLKPAEYIDRAKRLSTGKIFL
jgi:hypothetical protein